MPSRDKKAEDVIVLDLRKAGGFTDYFVICTGTNPADPRHRRLREETLRADLRARPH
jgi:ribosomal silencing factor RsfS